MSDERPIGPNPCANCGGEYGEHTETCPDRPWTKRDKMQGREVVLPLCPKCKKHTVAPEMHACLSRDCDWKDPEHWKS